MTKLYVSTGFFPEDYFQSTIDYIAKVQQPDGSIPWYPGGCFDPWDLVESAMGLTIGGRFEEAKQAYLWLKRNQLGNGSWLAVYKNGKVEDGTRAETNFVAYVATGVWHYYLITKDLGFLHTMWSVVARAIEFVLGMQGSRGEIYWALDTTTGVQHDSLVTGCSSIFKSLECALNIATCLERTVPHWALSRTRLGNALTNHPDCFDRTWESKSRFAMDWFYPVLTGVITGTKAHAQLQSRWDTFVVDELGCRCVLDQPWVTVAESCELVMALLSTGEDSRATQLFSWLHDYRDTDGSYWTGYVYPDDILWPEEKPTWTAGAVLLAADALSKATPAARLFTDIAIIDSSQETKRTDYRQFIE